eukprot:3027601-Amphidinium_carterae.1
MAIAKAVWGHRMWRLLGLRIVADMPERDLTSEDHKGDALKRVSKCFKMIQTMLKSFFVDFCHLDGHSPKPWNEGKSPLDQKQRIGVHGGSAQQLCRNRKRQSDGSNHTPPLNVVRSRHKTSVLTFIANSPGRVGIQAISANT